MLQQKKNITTFFLKFLHPEQTAGKQKRIHACIY
jgi:hypothetical protein